MAKLVGKQKGRQPFTRGRPDYPAAVRWCRALSRLNSSPAPSYGLTTVGRAAMVENARARPPLTNWLASGYQNLPVRILDFSGAARLRNACAASGQRKRPQNRPTK